MTGFWSVPGEVVAVDRWTETQVSSSSGRVLISGQHVSVTPPKVWADAVARKAVWIRTADSEFEMPVPDDVSVRAGHRIHAVASTVVGKGAGQWSALVNHDTSRWSQVDRLPPGGCYGWWTNFVMSFGRAFGNVGMGVVLLYAVPLAILVGVMSASMPGLFMGAMIGGGIGFCHCLLGALKARSAVSRHCNAVGEACQLVFKTP